MKEVWKSWQEVNSIAKNRKIILFGKSEDWAEKTFQAIRYPVAYVVDNNVNLEGTSCQGSPVHLPSVLLKEDKDSVYVLITSGAYDSIIPQLMDYGFEPGRHFCNVPLLNNLKTLSDIHSHRQEILVPAPDHHVYSQIDSKSNRGGGIYVYELETMQAEKIHSGSFHQIYKGNGCFYIIHHFEGVHIFSEDLKLLDKFPLDKNSKPHGVAFCPNRNLIFAACSGLDRVAVYDAQSYKKVNELRLSNRYEITGSEQHHINDLFVMDDCLFVSFFSFSGYCKQDVYDGGIRAYKIDDFSKYETLVHDLWMPHSVRFIDGTIAFLDSMRGNFHLGTRKIAGHFPGFIRGLCYDGQYYYIGQSEARYFDRLRGLSNSILLNSGFYLFDDASKATKFFSMSHSIRQVHDLYPLGE